MLVAVNVGVNVGVLVAVNVGVNVGVLVAVNVGVKVGVLVKVGVRVGVGVGVEVLVGVGVGVGGGAMLAFFLVITTIPCSYIILPTYSFTLYKFGENILPSPSSNKVPLTGLSNLKEFGFI